MDQTFVLVRTIEAIRQQLAGVLDVWWWAGIAVAAYYGFRIFRQLFPRNPQ